MNDSYGVLTVQDIWLASALSSFGVAFYQPDPIRRIIKNGKEICLFNFEPSDLGKELIKQWGDKSFIDQNPEHPLAYIKAFTHNRERLLDLVKQSPQVQIVQKGSRIFFLPLTKKPTAAQLQESQV